MPPPRAKCKNAEDQVNGVEDPVEVEEARDPNPYSILHAAFSRPWVHGPLQPGVEQIRREVGDEEGPAAPEIGYQ